MKDLISEIIILTENPDVNIIDAPADLFFLHFAIPILILFMQEAGRLNMLIKSEDYHMRR